MRLRAIYRLMLALGLAGMLAACAAAPGIATAPIASVDTGAEVRAEIQDYKLAVDDKVRVTVFGEAALSGDFTVSSTGNISLPLINEIHAAGQTAEQLKTRLTAALADGFLRQPNVQVEIITFGPFYILGEVNRPDKYPYSVGLTVLNAVATANGFTYRANTQAVFIKRAGEDVEHQYPLTASTQVGPGDTVRIVERRF